MTLPNDTFLTADPSLFMLKELTVRCLEAHEQIRAGELLKQEHYLGDYSTVRGHLLQSFKLEAVGTDQRL